VARVLGLAVLTWVLLLQFPLLVGAPGPMVGAGAAVGVVAAVAAIAVLGLVCAAVFASPAPRVAAAIIDPTRPVPAARQCDPAAAGRPHPRAPGRRATARAA
jgi:Family of unknown function (DUF6412)